MNKNYPKNYDVIVAFVVFLICILYALFSNFNTDALFTVASMN